MTESFGSLRALYCALQKVPSFMAKATARPVAILYGEENKIAQDQALPYVCMVPTGGSYTPGGSGYYVNDDPAVIVWMVSQNVDLYLWASSDDLNAEAIDHVDATETLRARVLQALQYQSPYGVKFTPLSERWEMMGDATNRYGRGLVLTVQVDLSIQDAPFVDATITSIELNPVEFVDSIPSHTLTEQP